MRVLILNWRDIENPTGGGAELLTHEMAKRWAGWGHRVTQISAGFPGGRKKEIVDGVKIIRLGRWWTVHLLAVFYYFRNLRDQVDVIVDEVHWFPFFAAVWAKKKTILLACEVASKSFFVYFPYFLAFFWRQLEKIYFLVYRNIPTLAISPSTKKDLVAGGFREGKITVLPMGLTIPSGIKVYPKEKKPTVIYLGRISKLKGAGDAVEAFKGVLREIPQARLWFVGSGLPDYEKKIREKVVDAGLNSLVEFFGYVSDRRKFVLLSRAHVLVVPSKHEGWGLIVSEAGAMGTPAVVYNVSGLRDVVKHGKTGLVCQKNTPEFLAKNLVALLKDRKRLGKLSKEAKDYYGKMNWSKTAKVALAVLDKV